MVTVIQAWMYRSYNTSERGIEFIWHNGLHVDQRVLVSMVRGKGLFDRFAVLDLPHYCCTPSFSVSKALFLSNQVQDKW